MPRLLKEDEHAAQRGKILDAAQRLIYTKGYEAMSVQDLLAELQISKGAFYHYFDSKAALLDALVDRMMEEAVSRLRPIVEDPDLPALEKLQHWIQAGGRWKTDQKDFMLALLRVWYTDANALVRRKQFAATVKYLAPMLAAIIRQGVAEGVFSMAYPDQIGGVLIGLTQVGSDTLAELLLMPEPPPDALEQIMRILAAYAEALERVLGAPAGSLPWADEATMRAWLDKPPAPKTARRPAKPKGKTG